RHAPQRRGGGGGHRRAARARRARGLDEGVHRSHPRGGGRARGRVRGLRDRGGLPPAVAPRRAEGRGDPPGREDVRDEGAVPARALELVRVRRQQRLRAAEGAMSDARPRLIVTGVGVFLPGRPSAAAWRAGVDDPTATRASGRLLDRMNRRRASALGRALVDAAAEAMDEAALDPSTVPTIVGSELGEVETMIGLLAQMWRRKEPASPAAFTMSDHNAASGLLSISTGN